MIWEICQDNKLNMIKNIYTSLKSEHALVKLTNRFWWNDWWYGITYWWGLLKLIDALVKLTYGACWWGWCEVNFNRVWNGVFWWTGIGSTDGGDVRRYRVWWWTDVWLCWWDVWMVTIIVLIRGLLMGGDGLIDNNRFFS